MSTDGKDSAGAPTPPATTTVAAPRENGWTRWSTVINWREAALPLTGILLGLLAQSPELPMVFTCAIGIVGIVAAFHYSQPNAQANDLSLRLLAEQAARAADAVVAKRAVGFKEYEMNEKLNEVKGELGKAAGLERVLRYKLAEYDCENAKLADRVSGLGGRPGVHPGQGRVDARLKDALDDLVRAGSENKALHQQIRELRAENVRLTAALSGGDGAPAPTPAPSSSPLVEGALGAPAVGAVPRYMHAPERAPSAPAIFSSTFDVPPAAPTLSAAPTRSFSLHQDGGVVEEGEEEEEERVNAKPTTTTASSFSTAGTWGGVLPAAPPAPAGAHPYNRAPGFNFGPFAAVPGSADTVAPTTTPFMLTTLEGNKKPQSAAATATKLGHANENVAPAPVGVGRAAFGGPARLAPVFSNPAAARAAPPAAQVTVPSGTTFARSIKPAATVAWTDAADEEGAAGESAQRDPGFGFLATSAQPVAAGKAQHIPSRAEEAAFMGGTGIKQPGFLSAKPSGALAPKPGGANVRPQSLLKAVVPDENFTPAQGYNFQGLKLAPAEAPRGEATSSNGVTAAHVAQQINSLVSAPIIDTRSILGVIRRSGSTGATGLAAVADKARLFTACRTKSQFALAHMIMQTGYEPDEEDAKDVIFEVLRQPQAEGGAELVQELVHKHGFSRKVTQLFYSKGQQVPMNVESMLGGMEDSEPVLQIKRAFAMAT